MRRAVVLLVPLIILAAACRSPFGAAPPEEGPDAGRVGRGIHGWPLLEHAPHGAGWRTDVLWPAYSQVRTDGDGLNQTDVLFPVFHVASEGSGPGKRDRTGLLRPLFDLETVGDDTWDLDVVWPLLKWRDAPDRWERRAFPLVRSAGRTDGSAEELDVLWPLYREERDARWARSHVFPLWWRGERHDEDAPEGGEGYTHAWPLWGREWDGTWARTWIGLPLFARTTDPEEDVSEVDVLFPLLHWGRAGDRSHVRALPLVWHDEAPHEHHTVVFPLWWDMQERDWRFRMLFPGFGTYESEDGDAAVSVGGPLYVAGNDGDLDYTWLAAPLVHWRSSPEGWGGHVFPVLWIDREEDGDGYTNLWPLFGWLRSGDSTTASVATPLFSYESDDDSWELDLPWPLVELTGRPDGGSSMVWPLFEHERRGGKTEGDVLFVLSTWESDEAQDVRDFRVLWRLVERSRAAGKETFVVNPLFRHESNDAGDTYWSFLFGLVARRAEAGTVDWRFLWVF